MKIQLSNMFQREHLTSNTDIINWWNRGRGLLNLLVLFYTILHLAIMVLVFKDGWIVFLLPIIFFIFIIINIIFSLGLLFEIIALRLFKSKINFDRIAPEIKKWEVGLSVLFILTLSFLHILNY